MDSKDIEQKQKHDRQTDKQTDHKALKKSIPISWGGIMSYTYNIYHWPKHILNRWVKREPKEVRQKQCSALGVLRAVMTYGKSY